MNAIHALVTALAAAVDQARAPEAGVQDARFAPPYSSLQIGTLRGVRLSTSFPTGPRR